MKNLVLILLVVVGLASCNNKNSQAQEGKTELQKIKSVEGFKTPESVLYSPADKAIFVSNINGKPAQIDSNGFISKLDTLGEVVDLQWVIGLNAPKGMGILKDTLFVTDIHDLVKINKKTGEILARIPVEGSAFLNDIAVADNGDVYISDSGNGKVYKYSDAKISVIAEKLTSPNGLFWQNDTLFVGCIGAIYVYAENKITKLCETKGMTDGLKRIDNHNFITSDWEGNVYIVTTDGKQTFLLKKEKGKNAADLEYIPASQKVLIPTFFDNEVDIYKLNFKK